MRRYKIAGGRIVKTGIAVFLTALICQLFNLPSVFAIITAIVTIEPTAYDSVRKGLVRLPASTIGAAIAMFFSFLLGESTLTYTLATILTIGICHRLKLDEGILVATLTAVAMIPGVQDHYLFALVSRFGTTLIGLVISTAVNFVIMPPKYYPIILKDIDIICTLIAETLQYARDGLFKRNGTQHKTRTAYRRLTQKITHTSKLSEYQREEFRYHKSKPNEMRLFHCATKQLNTLQQIVFHLGNFHYAHYIKDEFTQEERELLSKTIDSIIVILQNPKHKIPIEHYELIEQLDYNFWHWKKEHSNQESSHYHHQFNSHTVILYEILLIHDLLEELEVATIKKEKALHA
nr:aromatic acid exporter family protein [Bacillus solimangrovi]